jgi:predicted cupin superfamily sugar epimerase
MDDTARSIIERLGLKPHPEGGFYREIYRSPLVLGHPAIPPGRGRERRGSTSIYFLLAAGQISAFHRLRWSDEIWHLYAGGPLELHTIDGDGRHALRLLARDLERGEPVGVVPGGCWQAARLAEGAPWALSGCTVAPGFEFDDFEMPPRAALVESYPAHAALIRELTPA